ncbi:MAG: uroporphyrinogen-III synthase [Hyphomicrobiaceae bacterium]|nr:uroporphyrinogen-III synthase [Hyphomicrobiaceae bacterium]
MRILVTRPEPDAQETARRLEALGHEAIVSPLLTVELLPIADVAPGGIVQAVIATSRNAARALAVSPVVASLAHLPAFAVGQATADALHALGFHGVVEGPGTASGLAGVVAANAAPEAGRLVHFAGETMAFDLQSALETRGFRVETILAYRTHRAAALTAEAQQAIAAGHIDAVILMSPATARRFGELAGGLVAAAHAPLLCVAISTATAEALPQGGPFETIVSTAPNLEEILALVNRMAALSRP